MASLWRRAMVYLGLVDDEEYEYEYEEAHAYAPPAPPQPVQAGPPVRPVPQEEPGLPPPQRPSVVRTIAPTSARVHVVEPDSFNDAQEVGDRLKASQPVILNLQGIDRDLQRRLIDFSSGLAYALAGHMARVADEVFLLTPTNVEVSAEEKERLSARGLYTA
jgi:cell division inhibitor SepF